MPDHPPYEPITDDERERARREIERIRRTMRGDPPDDQPEESSDD